MSDEFYYSRRELAITLADNLLGGGIASYRSGLFLAAPRRTGKTTFLRRDLTPVLVERGVQVIYVDLWEDRTRDPTDLLRSKLIEAQHSESGWVNKAWKTIRPRKVEIAGIGGIDINDAQAIKQASLTELLANVATTSRRDIALIVDEAQHVRVSSVGAETMSALKAARDAFGQQKVGGDNARLVLLFTGSDVRKLSDLTRSRKAAFYGARLDDFPQLDDGYCNEYAHWLNQRLAEHQKVEGDRIVPIFAKLGRRPELLAEVIRDALFGEGMNSLEKVTEQYLDRLKDEFSAGYTEFDELQQHLIQQLAEQSRKFRPFGKDTLSHFRQNISPDITISQIQTAIRNLEREGVIWSPARGVYEVEDGEFARWIVTQNLPT